MDSQQQDGGTHLPRTHRPKVSPQSGSKKSDTGTIDKMVIRKVSNVRFDRRTPRAPGANVGLKKLFGPVMLLLGLLLLLPAIWAAGLLLGFEVAAADKPNAKAMAGVMLICWPLGLFMLGGGAFMLYQAFGGQRGR